MAIEKFITPFIESQFPQFYRDEGPNFISFVKSYYEWLEQNGNVIERARALPSLLDIDATEEQFINYFKSTYISSLPSNIIVDKRLLIKHITELYRSKGTKRSYEFLFRLLFNEDIDLYIPNEHLARSSDAMWYEPQYIEVSDSEFLPYLIGKKIVSPAATAVVESYFTKLVQGKVINVLLISDVVGRFKFDEKIYCDDLYVKRIYQNGDGVQINQIDYDELMSFGDLQNLDINVDIPPDVVTEQEQYSLIFFDVINGYEYSQLTSDRQADYFPAITFDNAPIVFGSLSAISIENGGLGFSVGDLLNVSGSGSGAIARVAATRSENGRVQFKLVNGGYGFTKNATIEVSGGYGTGATFQIGDVTDKQIYKLNTDPILDSDLQELDSAAAGFDIHFFPTVGDISTYTTVSSSANVISMDVRQLIGNVAFGDTLSNTSLGIGGLYVYNSDINSLQITGDAVDLTNGNLIPNVRLTNGKSGDDEAVVIINVVFPIKNINASADIFESTSSVITTQNNLGYFVPSATLTISKSGSPDYTSTITSTVRNTTWGALFPKPDALEINSNLDTPTIGEILTFEELIIGKIAYLTNINPGIGYAFAPTVTITEPAIYSYKIRDADGTIWGHNANVVASASVAGGVVTAVEVVDSGFGYIGDETLHLNSANNQASVTGAAVVDLNGVASGYWKNNKSFLSDTNNIQDSDYYQTYSYEIISSRMFQTYEKIVKDLIHPAGLKLFGKYRVSDQKTTETSIAVGFGLITSDYFRVDNIAVKSDDTTLTVDKYNLIY
jgi:hypothetical protein